MQRIHVKRYVNAPGYQGMIEPEDRSWIVFVASDGEATLWRRVELNDLDTPEGSQTDHAYVDVELLGHVTEERLRNSTPSDPLPPPLGENPFDFTVTPMREPMMDAIDPAAHAREDELFPDRRDGFFAMLNCRNVGSWGATEHEAIKNLLNYVVKLCVAGCLDHTGEPMAHSGSKRRYEAVFGPIEP